MHSKESADLLLAPRWLLPIAPDNLVLTDHAVVVTGGRIVAVGPESDLAARFEPRERISRPDHALLPGFVNAHTRAAMCLLRGLPVFTPLMRWLQEVVAPAELRSVSPDFVREGTQLAIAEMLRAGITTFADSYLYPEEAARTAAEARVRAVIGMPVAESATAWAEDTVAHFARAEGLWDDYKSSPWVSLYFAPPPSCAIGDGLLGRLRSVADELDARIAMPVHQTQIEVRHTLRDHGRRPLRRLADLGLLRPGFTALHMNHLHEDDLELAERTAISVVACPQSDLRLASGSCPVDALVARKVTVALGTDSPMSAGALDILAEARTAALFAGAAAAPRGMDDYSGGEFASAGLSAAAALSLATLGGASALGLGGTCGSIEIGKAADLVCIDLAQLATQPLTAIAEAVLFSATRHQVRDVWVGGRAAVSEGRLLAFDEQELIQLARRWAGRIQMGVAA